MTFRRTAVIALMAALAGAGAYAASLPENTSLSVTVDAAFSPKTDFVAGDTHFAPLTGFYGGIEGRVTGRFGYVIPTPLGSNWLLSDANVELAATLELTPVTLTPGIQAAFTPLPFVVLSAGSQIGSGWSLAGFSGTGLWNGADTYDPYAAFSKWFFKAWFQATLQFDTGAIIQGDWSHVVMLFSYQAYYTALLGTQSQQVWLWQNSGNRANGWQQYMQGVVAYQMPLVLKRAGIMFESDGYYSDAAFARAQYDGDFKSISLSPLLQFEFSEHHALSVLIHFSSRRSFAQAHDNANVEPNLTQSGREWYFKRVALSYTYTF